MRSVVEAILLDILDELRNTGHLDDKRLAKIIHAHDRNLKDNRQHHAKKKLLPFYLKVKRSDPERWARWGIDPDLEKRLLQVLQVKPRRTASGVATITVITKPWACSSDCLYCPNDVRMPKSYLSDEPACQRAEQNHFDPYLQVSSRLRALTQMGHSTDKVELIILGGTWSDYPEAYQLWFVSELFRALNDGDQVEENARERRRLYQEKGFGSRGEEHAESIRAYQHAVDAGTLTYNQAVGRLYGENEVWQSIADLQKADFDALHKQHDANERAAHRVVGLVIETRPDAITSESLRLCRRLGCTKIQIGIQSLDQSILEQNRRHISPQRIQEAFELLRIFGFKIHAHFMVNLYGSSCEADKRDYERFVTEAAYQPDEVKLYPCALVNGTGLCAHYADGTWRAYSEEELVDILVSDMLVTPPFVRISRMIRDISACDIVAGNKKANLRQMVENRLEETGAKVSEIRYREISTSETDVTTLAVDTFAYRTTVTREYFMQWVTPENKIAGFLRLSLPDTAFVREHQVHVPVEPLEAMIREVHIYGRVAGLHETGTGAQHLGLGKRLIEAACTLARREGYKRINVISSVGTREYYRGLGFEDGYEGLYQQMTL